MLSQQEILEGISGDLNIWFNRIALFGSYIRGEHSIWLSKGSLARIKGKVLFSMEEKVKELTLLLLYLTSWKEDDSFGEMSRSWKGYPFEVLNELTNADLIRGSKRSRSVYLTREGIKEAKALVGKYLNEKEDGQS